MKKLFPFVLLFVLNTAFSKDYSQSEQFYENLIKANDGDIYAMNLVYQAYLYGNGVEPNKQLALTYLVKAARAKDLNAMMDLQNHYKKGLINNDRTHSTGYAIPKNQEAADKLEAQIIEEVQRQADELGLAAMVYGSALKTGSFGLKADPLKAYDYIEKAVKLAEENGAAGNIAEQLFASDLYANGSETITPDLHKSLQLLEKIAPISEEARRRMLRTYIGGWCCKRVYKIFDDYQTAEVLKKRDELLTHFATSNDYTAQYLYAGLLGEDCEGERCEMAIKLYEQALSQKPKADHIMESLAELHMKLGHADEALQYVISSAVVEPHPNHYRQRDSVNLLLRILRAEPYRPSFIEWENDLFNHQSTQTSASKEIVKKSLVKIVRDLEMQEKFSEEKSSERAGIQGKITNIY